MSRTAALSLHPDRLLPADPGVRTVARRLYDAVRELPIISPHGHVDPRILLADTPFSDPAALFVTPDHYVTRMLHASGVPVDALGVGKGPLSEQDARAAWRLLCAH
jgi:glucuronate isomerase